MAYSEYVPTWERPVISALLSAILDGGNTVSVYDTEDYVLKRSRSINAIRGALGGSGEDMLYIRNQAGEDIGCFYLIYNNGSEHDPMTVIADYVSNDFCDAIYDALFSKYA